MNHVAYRLVCLSVTSSGLPSWLVCRIVNVIVRLDQELMSLVVFLVLVLVGTTLFNKSLRPRRFKSHRDEIWQDCYANTHRLTKSIFDLTPYVQLQDGGHDVISRPPAARLCVCSSIRPLPLARRTRVTSVPDP